MDFQVLYENASVDCSNLQVMLELHQRLAVLADVRSRQFLISAAISPHDESGTAFLSDMNFVIQCGLCPELISFCRRIQHGRTDKMLNLYKVAIEIFERNQSVVEFHIRDFLCRLQRHLRQVCDAN